MSTAVPTDYEGLLKCLFYLKMWSCWKSSFTLGFLFCNGHSFWNSQCQCPNWLNVTAYHNAPWHYKNVTIYLWQCFTGIYVYAYLTVQSSLVSEGRGQGGLKPTFHFRYCGTIKDLTLKRSLCSQNGLLPLVRFIGLGVFCLSSLSAKDLDASHHCTCTKMLPWLFLYF